MPNSAETCPDCGCALSWASDHCDGCGKSAAAPNVREVAAEGDALAKRFTNAVGDNKKRGCEQITAAFERDTASKSVAVINLSPEFLGQMLRDDKSLYSGYALQTDAETRRAANDLNDRERRGTEGTLFGDYGPQIRYASLSLDGVGLTSYGSCTVSLRDALCQNKGTLLEENSYGFVRRHRIMPGDAIPEGWRAGWKDRQYLATAKVAARLTSTTTQQEFAKLLLHSVGDRSTDDFIEVHIHGSFGRNAFVAAVIPRPEGTKDRNQAFNLGEVRDLLDQLNIPCTQI